MNPEKNSDERNYQSYLILGIIFFSTGITLGLTQDNPGFYGIAALGFVFLIIAFSNSDKWKKIKDKGLVYPLKDL